MYKLDVKTLKDAPITYPTYSNNSHSDDISNIRFAKSLKSVITIGKDKAIRVEYNIN